MHTTYAPAQGPPQKPGSDPSIDQSLEQRVTDLTQQVAELKSLVQALQKQLAGGGQVPATQASVQPPEKSTTALPSEDKAVAAPSSTLPLGFTLNALLDGYYEYNLNSPVGRVNELRAYDVSQQQFQLESG